MNNYYGNIAINQAPGGQIRHTTGTATSFARGHEDIPASTWSTFELLESNDSAASITHGYQDRHSPTQPTFEMLKSDNDDNEEDRKMSLEELAHHNACNKGQGEENLGRMHSASASYPCNNNTGICILANDESRKHELSTKYDNDAELMSTYSTVYATDGMVSTTTKLRH